MRRISRVRSAVNISTQTLNGRRLRAGKARTGAFVWERFKNIGKIFLGFAVALTLAYVLFLSLPAVWSGSSASPIVKTLPSLNKTILVFHIITAIPALMIGIFGFSKRLRKASPRVHRWIGTIYCVAIWISATLGVMLALANTHGPLAKAGFTFLGLAWFGTTLKAYTAARAKDIRGHRRWMFRSFALTLAVVSIRPMFIFGPLWGGSTNDWFVLLTWICWVPNLIVAEIYIRMTQFDGQLASGSRRKLRSGMNAVISSS